MRKLLGILLLIVAVIVIAGVGVVYFSREEATVPIEQTFGPNPTLAEPNPTWLPTINVAKAMPWPEGTRPTATQGFAVNEFAGGLDHPRWLHILPNGDVLVAESNAPPQPDEGFSIRGFY
jgi:glucose/arabinose dehydrogenase